MPTRSTSTTRGNPYCLDVAKVLQECNRTGEGCDVEVKCGGESFPAHSFWLKRTVPYFATAASTGVGGVQGASRTQVEAGSTDPFDLRDSPLSEDALRLVLDALYGEMTHITVDNCVEIHRAANYLGLDELASLCITEMSTFMSLSNVFDLLKYASGQFEASHEVLDICQTFILQHAEYLGETEGWLCLQMQYLTMVLHRKSSTEHLTREYCLFEAILMWVMYDPFERCKQLKALLALIFFEEIDFAKLLTAEVYLAFMASDDLDSGSKAVVGKLVRATEKDLDDLIGPMRSKIPKHKASLEDLILIERSFNGSSGCTALKLSSDAVSWLPAQKNLDSSSDLGGQITSVLAATLEYDVHEGVMVSLLQKQRSKGSIMVLFHGRNLETESQSHLPGWCEAAHSARAEIMSHGMSFKYGNLYVWTFMYNVHARSRAYSIRWCEYSDFDSSTVGKKQGNVTFHRLDGCGVNSQFYAYGDHIFASSPSQPFRRVLTTGAFPPSRGLSSRLLFNHFLPGVTAYRGKLYVAGGVEGQRRVECFDPNLGAWVELPALLRNHEDIILTGAKDRLFVIDKRGEDKKVDWLNLLEPTQGWQPGPGIPLDAFGSDGEFFAVSNSCK